MSDVVIRAEGLGKKYRIGHQAQSERYTALRDVVVRNAKGLARSARDVVRGRQLVAGDEVEDFWALRDVNFEIKRGEVVGIIGRNGAGKSTLLKILSRITEPTTGRVEIKGRVASLLEVGTGFHPELTGRENIYLNGAILGMTRSEIRRKFDEIVAFAEVEKFLDTPVKRYSSGMYVRLAFAVAAHLEPEILIVDEVLAVGDAEFQKKCLGKMGEVAGHGRTVLFVSHNIVALQRICKIGLMLSSGYVAFGGEINQCVGEYLHNSLAPQEGHRILFSEQSPKKAHVIQVEILDDQDRPLPRPKTHDYVRFRIYFHSPNPLRNGSVELNIALTEGPILTVCATHQSNFRVDFKSGRNVIDCDFPSLMLSAGSFRIGASLSIPNVEWLDNQPGAATLSVEAQDIFNSGVIPVASSYPVLMDHNWHMPALAPFPQGEPLAI